MNGSADHKITLFTEALQLAAYERGMYLERACKGDMELCHAVEALLQEYERIGDFLEGSPNASKTKAKAANDEAVTIDPRAFLFIFTFKFIAS